MEILIDTILLDLDEDEESLPLKVMKVLSLERPVPVRIIRKSLDARNKKHIHYRYRVIAAIDDRDSERLLGLPGVSPAARDTEPVRVPAALKGARIAVIGSGPAGIFCAMRLIEHGAEVHVFERGKPVEDRIRDIHALENHGVLNRESNVLFGEGGAGTYSDGKLTARTKRPEAQWVFSRLVDMGAPASILYDARPHLGTDMLAAIIRNIRACICSRGSSIHYSERMDDLIIQGDAVKGFVTSLGREHRYDHVFLAPGHSARDTYDMLRARNVALSAKPFAVGARVEHPREMIDSIQYGASKFRDMLPAAEYALTYKNTSTGKGTYTFCMCPGGRIINSSSEPGGSCVNGMSNSRRDTPFSNAAIVVTVGPADWGPGPLDGILFQRKIEEAAFLCSGNSAYAPAQRITSFMKNKIDRALPPSSYRPGIVPASLRDYIPEQIAEELLLGLRAFDKRMKGFITEEGVLVGAETRTSSPVRIVRDKSFQSVSHRGLFPIGEGSGYSGGIISSAVDGIRAADTACALLNKQ